MADDKTWTFTLDDGDHVVKTETQGGTLRILVDGLETGRTRVKGQITQAFRVGGHVARVEGRAGRSFLATLAWLWFFGFLILFILAASNSRRGMDSEAAANFCLIGGFPLIFVFNRGKPKVDLYVRDKYIPPGKHTVVVPRAQPAAPPPPQPAYQSPVQHIYIHQTPASTAQPAPQQSSPAAMIPKLPAKCESCGQPLSMDNVRWAGPLNARCPACDAAVEVKWEKIG